MKKVMLGLSVGVWGAVLVQPNDAAAYHTEYGENGSFCCSSSIRGGRL
jgi:hypothetical protein